VTLPTAAREAKKKDEGTRMPQPELNSKSDPVAVADPRETQSLTPATTNTSSDILINCRNWF
jgi:hypothetical protein